MVPGELWGCSSASEPSLSSQKEVEHSDRLLWPLALLPWALNHHVPCAETPLKAASNCCSHVQLRSHSHSLREGINPGFSLGSHPQVTKSFCIVTRIVFQQLLLPDCFLTHKQPQFKFSRFTLFAPFLEEEMKWKLSSLDGRHRHFPHNVASQTELGALGSCDGIWVNAVRMDGLIHTSSRGVRQISPACPTRISGVGHDQSPSVLIISMGTPGDGSIPSMGVMSTG